MELRSPSLLLKKKILILRYRFDPTTVYDNINSIYILNQSVAYLISSSSVTLWGYWTCLQTLNFVYSRDCFNNQIKQNLWKKFNRFRIIDNTLLTQNLTWFTAVTLIPRFTALAGARFYVTVLTVNVLTGNRTVRSVISCFRTSCICRFIYFSIVKYLCYK